MKTASVSELKAHLSRYLRMARRGSEVQVLERGVPIARLVGIDHAASSDRDRIERLSRAGVLRQGKGDASWVLDEPPVAIAGADLASALDEAREDRF